MSLSARWIAATTLAGALSALLTDFIGLAVNAFAGPDTAGGLLWIPMLLTGALEGAVLGALQCIALRRSRTPLRSAWIARTALAFLVAWALGMALSTYEPTVPWPRIALFAAAAVGGVGLGALVGAAQGALLGDPGRLPRADVRRPVRSWIAANAAGWAAAMVVAALAAELVPWGPYVGVSLAVSVLGGALGGGLLGVATAPTLRALIRP